MKISLDIEDALLEKAAQLSGITENSTLVRLGLQALIARESAKGLASLGESEKALTMTPRRRGNGI